MKMQKLLAKTSLSIVFNVRATLICALAVLQKKMDFSKKQRNKNLKCEGYVLYGLFSHWNLYFL